MVNAVYCCDLQSNLTCQNPLLKSIMEKCTAPAMLFNASCIQGRGYESFLVHTISHLKSTQKHSIPSFFCTSITALDHGDWLDWMAPASNITQSDACTSSSKGRGICLKHSLKDSSSSMLILCLIALVHPSSLGLSVKMFWYNRSNSLASVTLWGTIWLGCPNSIYPAVSAVSPGWTFIPLVLLHLPQLHHQAAALPKAPV